MEKTGRRARIQKTHSDKFANSSNHIPNCYAPPPPPLGDEDGWDLQFCKWWGWNWVKKEINYVSKIEPNLVLEERSVKEQGGKRARGAGDSPSSKPKPEKSSYFKQLRSLFVKMKHSSSLQKLFNTPSVSRCCYHANCKYSAKKNNSEPVSSSNRCICEDSSCSKGEVDSSGSTLIATCSSIKQSDTNQRPKKPFQNHFHVSKTDSFQQTHDARKVKKKKYYHLVCSSCYPQICCCRCHKRTDANSAQHSIQSKVQDSLRISRRSKSATHPKKIMPESKLYRQPPSCFYSHQHLSREPKVDRKRPNPVQSSTYQVSPLQMHPRDIQKKYPRCLEKKECSNFGQRHVCSDHENYRKLISFDDCLCGKKHSVDQKEQCPEKENPIIWNSSINEEYLRSKKVPIHDDKSNLQETGQYRNDRPPWQSSLPEIPEPSVSEELIVPEKSFGLQPIHHPDPLLPSLNKLLTPQYHRSRQENYNNHVLRQEPYHKEDNELNQRATPRKESKILFNRQKNRPYLESHSYPVWRGYKQDLSYRAHSRSQDWSPISKRPFQARKYVHQLSRPRSNRVRHENARCREYSTCQKVPPIYENASWDDKLPCQKRPPCPIRASCNYEDVPCKKPRMCDIPEKEDPYKTYQDWNRVTFGKNMFPKFGFYANMYPRIQNTKSDILDKYYSVKLEEEFFSPVSGKTYNLTPRSFFDADYYTSSTIPDPIDVGDDLKYIENLSTTAKVDKSSRVMLDAVCDAILFRNGNNLTTESTLIRKYSYQENNIKKTVERNDEKNETKRHTERRTSEDCYRLPENFEVLFMERVETLVNSILNSRLNHSRNTSIGDFSECFDNSNYLKRSKSPLTTEPLRKSNFKEVQTEPQSNIGDSLTDQVNKLNNLFEKMDEITTKSKANVEKIQQTMKSLPNTYEDALHSHPETKESTDQQFTSINVELLKNFTSITKDSSLDPSSSKIETGDIQHKINDIVFTTSDETLQKNVIDHVPTTRAVKTRNPIKNRRLRLKMPIRKKNFIK